MAPSIAADAAAAAPSDAAVDSSTPGAAAPADLTVAAAAPSSFLELYDTPPLLPWHERAYANGPRPVPPPESGIERWTKWLREHPDYVRQLKQPKPPKQRAKRMKLSAIDWTKRDQHVLDAVKQKVTSAYARCPCVQCTILQRDNQAPVAYRCPARYCHMQFADYLELFEHQVAEHGKLLPHCRRVRMELFGQDRGVVPYPPVTVYAGQQLLSPGYRPTEWTLARVDEEAQTLYAQLFGKKVYAGAVHIWDAFTIAYHQVRQGGVAQLQAQYALALEYYNSSLVFPVATRTAQDGADAVGDGRNWLVSPELARAKHTTPFRHELTPESATYRFRDTMETDPDAQDDDEDDSDGELASTLLLETGDPIAPAMPTVEPSEAAKRLAAMPPWEQFLAPTDVHVARAIAVKKLARPRRTPKCRGCGRRGHDNRAECGLSKPRAPKRCKLCGVAGHTRVTCPDKALHGPNAVTRIRCGKCGLLGHSRKRCYQVPGFSSATVATVIDLAP